MTRDEQSRAALKKEQALLRKRLEMVALRNIEEELEQKDIEYEAKVDQN